MSIHAVDKKEWFIWCGTWAKIDLSFLSFACIGYGQKSRGILVVEMWKPRKWLSVATFGDKNMQHYTKILGML